MTERTEHFVTLFDSAFLPQGLALHSSLRRHTPDSILWVLCMDSTAYQVLQKLELPGMQLVSINEIETPDLDRIKKERSIAEYCWTVTPLTPKLVFDRDPSARRVTYLDADLYFLRSPDPLFQELDESGKAILITEHDYDPIYDRSATHGRFCVQFVTFVRGESEAVRSWWQARCEEWCYARLEDGKFGDQKYLDDWPDRFGGQVHVLQQKGVLLAPWNARRYSLERAVAWHFHGLRLLGSGRALLFSNYEVPQFLVKQVYKPYLAELRRQLGVIEREVVQARIGGAGFWYRYVTGAMRMWLLRIARRLLERPGAVGRL